MPRTLYLVAYDVCGDARRLARVGRYFQSYRVAGQKSVPEIWVTPAELRTISADMAQLLDSSTDRLQLVAQQTLTAEHFSTSSSSGCLLGKAGRTRFYGGYEENAQALRRAMAHSVQALRQQVGPHDDAPGQQPAHAQADHADDAESYNDA